MTETGGASALSEVAANASEALAALMSALKDPEALVCTQAARAVIRIDPGKKGQVLPVLIGALQDKSWETRKAAIECLAMLGPNARPAVPALVKALKDANAYVRGAAAGALGKTASGARTVVPALLETFKKERTDYVRRLAVEALGQIGPEAKEAVPILIEALKANDGYLRALAATALGQMGPASRAAIPALVEAALRAQPSAMRKTAAAALKKIDPKAAKKAGVH